MIQHLGEIMAPKRALARILFGLFCIGVGLTLGLYDVVLDKVRSITTSAEFKQGDEEFVCAATPTPIDETLDIRHGDNFSSVLNRAGVSSDQIQSIIESLKGVFNPRELRTDHDMFMTYEITCEEPIRKDLLRLFIKLSLDQEVVIERTDSGEFIARKIQKELVHEYRAIKGTIKDSLYMDATKQGANAKILQQMIQNFSYDVDFQRGFQPGDKYELYYDTLKDPEGLQEKPGNLIYASLTLQGKTLKIYSFKPAGGAAQFYNDKGESVKKGLLRTPIDGAKISSGFGSRKHPVLGFTKMHKGVDFRAPVGTPIMAAGDGRIVKIGPWSTYGNYIRIQHSGAFSTAYAHLSRFSKGLKSGTPVRQGQIIGYVGATGRVTGPHLHYELLKGGTQINPKSITMMPAGKLKGSDMTLFSKNKTSLDQIFQKL